MKRKAKTVRFSKHELVLINKKKGNETFQSYIDRLVKSDLGIHFNHQTSLFNSEPTHQLLSKSEQRYIKYGKKYLSHIQRLKNLHPTNPKRVEKAMNYIKDGHSINSTSRKFHVGKYTIYKILRQRK